MMKSRCCRTLAVLTLLLAFALPATAEESFFAPSTAPDALAMLPCGTPGLEPIEAEPTFFEDAAPAFTEAQPEKVDLAGTTTCNSWVNYGCCLDKQRQRRLCNYRNGTINEWYYEYRCLTGGCPS